MPVFKRIPFLVFFLSILWIVTAEPCQANYRILIETDQYRLAKYEPRSGAYLGAYVFQDTLIQGNMATFNEITGKKHASFFLYVGYGKPVPTKWLEELKKVGAFAHIAWEPNDGLDVVKDDAYLRSFARDLAAAEMPIFLRLPRNERQLDGLRGTRKIYRKMAFSPPGDERRSSQCDHGLDRLYFSPKNHPPFLSGGRLRGLGRGQHLQRGLS